MTKQNTSTEKLSAPATKQTERGEDPAILAALLDQVEEICFILDRNFRIEYTNRFAQLTFDFNAQDLLGLSFAELLPYSKGMQETPDIQQTLASGKSVRAEVQSPLSGRWFRMIASPFQGNYLFNLKEISGRKRYQNLLLEKDARFIAITEAMSDVILFLNMRGRITYASPASATLTGFEAEELEEEMFADFLTPEALQRLQKEIEAISSRPNSRATFPITMLHKDGHEVELNAHAKNLIKRAGVEGILLNLRSAA